MTKRKRGEHSEDLSVKRSTFRSGPPIGRGTMTSSFIESLKEVNASQELIDWAETRPQAL